MNGIKIKKVYGEKSVIVTDMAIDLVEAYRVAVKGRMGFYVQRDGELYAWGLFSVADYMGLTDSSVAFDRVNA